MDIVCKHNELVKPNTLEESSSFIIRYFNSENEEIYSREIQVNDSVELKREINSVWNHFTWNLPRINRSEVDYLSIEDIYTKFSMKAFIGITEDHGTFNFMTYNISVETFVNCYCQCLLNWYSELKHTYKLKSFSFSL